MKRELRQKIKISENDIKILCKEYLKIMGWFIFPILQGMGCYKGITDFIAVKGGRVLFIETKSPTGTHRKEQKEFQEDIELHGGEYWLVDCWEDILKMISDR